MKGKDEGKNSTIHLDYIQYFLHVKRSFSTLILFEHLMLQQRF